MSSAVSPEPVLVEELPATVLALFDDPIDAEHALQTLRKRELAATGVSLLVRNRDPAVVDDSMMNVARDLVAAALGAAANWLTGLAELIVTEQGRFLVAGPMGAALTGAGRSRAETAGQAADPDQLYWVLTKFGFAEPEVAYVEQRLTAGTTLLAISTEKQAELAKARDVFDAQDAVFVSMAPTDAEFLATISSFSAAAPSPDDPVVVADMLAPVREAPIENAWDGLRGREVRSQTGDEAGLVDRVLVPDGLAADPATAAPRYLVLTFGGMLGIGRRRVIVPNTLVDYTADPIRVAASRDALHRAPPYDAEIPVTRRDEELVHQHFGLVPYWRTEAAGEIEESGVDVRR